MRDVTDQRELEQTLRTRAGELASIAYVDALTGLPNRRRLVELRDQAVRDALRRDEPLTLLVIDVDRFKAYNDRYGHLAGDACLADVAGAIAAALRRPTDMCGRHGGEEFVAVLPNTDERGAREVAEQVRAAVQGLNRAHEGSSVGVVTVSIGAATGRLSRSPDGDGASCVVAAPDCGTVGDELFQVADAALYRAKQGGRNIVEAVSVDLIGTQQQPVA